MRKQIKWKAPSTVDVFFFQGAILVSVGLGLWLALWAGLVSAGVFSLAAAVLSEKGEESK